MTPTSNVPPTASDSELDALFMARALELAGRGEGYVEPNPMVGCVIIRDGEVIGEGWHRQFGGPHAEIEALRIAGARARDATAYITLEPCCHHGKTPPCTEALISAGLTRVVCAQRDQFEAVSGRGIAALQAAGIVAEVGLLDVEARRLNAPYLKLVTTGRPWIIAKWAMTLDGKIATHTGDSRWISGEESRKIVQALRGRVDAIVVGHGTALRDDPLLIARPAGPRTATRIVVDSEAATTLDSQLVRTVADAPVLIAAGVGATQENVNRLEAAGCEVVACGVMPERTATRSAPPSRASTPPNVPIGPLLDELGRRRMTNVLVEGGGQLLGSLMDAAAIDEVHVFIAPKLVGGGNSPSPIAGHGLDIISAARKLSDVRWRHVGDDLYLHARIDRS